MYVHAESSIVYVTNDKGCVIIGGQNAVTLPPPHIPIPLHDGCSSSMTIGPIGSDFVVPVQRYFKTQGCSGVSDCLDAQCSDLVGMFC